MDIYIDVLFMENLLINYIILLLVSRVFDKNVLPLRLFASSIVGAMYVVLMVICPNVELLYTVLFKVLLSVIMVKVAFSLVNIREFVKYVCAFYVATFVLAGSMFFFIYLSKSGGIVKNGVVYMFINSRNSFFVKAILTVSLTLKVLINYIRSRSVSEKLIVPIDLEVDNRDLSINALLDTGASLSDPFSNQPIVIVEFKSIQRLLPKEVRDIFNKSKSNDLKFVVDSMEGSEWFKRFRMIPFNSLGNKNGMLIGFTADNVKIVQDEVTKEFSNVVIAVYEELLTSGNSYQALIGLNLYNSVGDTSISQC